MVYYSNSSIRNTALQHSPYFGDRIKEVVILKIKRLLRTECTEENKIK